METHIFRRDSGKSGNLRYKFIKLILSVSLNKFASVKRNYVGGLTKTHLQFLNKELSKAVIKRIKLCINYLQVKAKEDRDACKK